MNDEKKRLRTVFDDIAEEFARTRDRPWAEVSAFVADVPRGRVALDVGCANGRHVPGLLDRFEVVVGVDFSRALLSIARSAHPAASFVRGEATAFPIADRACEVALCVAVLHHLPSTDERAALLAELSRVLAPGGAALIGVWAIEHPAFDGEREAIRANDNDTYVPWTADDGTTHDRYYHVFERDDLRSLLDASPLTVDRLTLRNGNYYAYLRR
ncbi:MAG: class I SAM-dependent methyltransferase [Haloferacaceae archaeon]